MSKLLNDREIQEELNLIRDKIIEESNIGYADAINDSDFFDNPLKNLIEEQTIQHAIGQYQKGRDSVGGESIAEAWERGRRVGIRSFEMNDDSEYFKTRESIIETLCGILWMKTWSEAKQNERRFETVMSFMRHFDKYVDKRIQDSYKPKDKNGRKN